MTWIQTRSGRAYDLKNPNPNDVILSDIIWSLSGLNRFVGHTRPRISVAEHSVLVYARVRQTTTSPEIRLAALAHDFHEAYIGDLPSPLKEIVPDLRHVDYLSKSAVASAFDIQIVSPCIIDLVRDADVRMLVTEAFHGLVDLSKFWSTGDAPLPWPYKPRGLGPRASAIALRLAFRLAWAEAGRRWDLQKWPALR